MSSPGLFRGSELFRVPPSVRACQALSVFGLAFFVLYALVGFGGEAIDHAVNDWLYNALIVCAAVISFLRFVWVRSERGAWLALSIALASWAAGELVFTFLYADAPPTPSLAD